ncbi:hypothetical protein EMIT0P74_20038 [Pseudomonas sp. IT-P74]
MPSVIVNDHREQARSYKDKDKDKDKEADG